MVIQNHISTSSKLLKSVLQASPLAWAVLLIGLLFTFFIWDSFEDVVKTGNEQRFLQLSKELETSIHHRLGVYAQVLNNSKGLFVASDNVNRDEWKQYVENINIEKDYPGIQGVGYSEVISPENLNQFTEQIRSEGFEDFHVHPVGKRNVYTAIKYLEPFDWRNQRAFGYDMFSEKNRRTAMELARDSGETSISNKITLLQETKDNPEDIQAGFLMYVPLYQKDLEIETVAQRRKAIQGYVYSPFRMNDLINATLVSEAKLFNLCIYDGDAVTTAALMYCSTSAPVTISNDSVTQESSKYSAKVSMRFGENQWLIHTKSTAMFENGVDKSPGIFAWAGTVVSLLLFTIVSLLRGRALKELSNERRKHELILRSAGNGIYGVDQQGKCTFINNTALELLQLQQEEIIGKSVHALIHHSKSDGANYPSEECPMSSVFKEGKIHSLDKEVFWRKDGSSFPVSYSSTPLRDGENELIGAVVTFSDISENLQAQKALRDSEEKNRLIVNNSHDAFLAIDEQGKILEWNPSAEDVFGYASEEAIGRSLHSLIIPKQFHDAHLSGMKHFINTGEESVLNRVIELPAQRYDGQEFPVELTISPIPTDKGYIFSAFIRDITERKQAEEKLLASEKQQREIYQNINEFVAEAKYSSDDTSILKIESITPQIEKITGYAPLEFINDSDLLLNLVHKKNKPELIKAIEQLSEKGVASDCQFKVHHKSGADHWVNCKFLPQYDSTKGANSLIVVGSDITDVKNREEQLMYAAFHDSLTGLPNRELFFDRMQLAIDRIKRNKSYKWALLFIDLDGFKEINDTFGHEAGDKYLIQVARIIQSCLRAIDTFARLGGDEFVILLEDIAVLEDTEIVSDRIQNKFKESFPVDDIHMNASVSIGIARCDQKYINPSEVLRDADCAMYQAKQMGKARYVVFDEKTMKPNMGKYQ